MKVIIKNNLIIFFYLLSFIGVAQENINQEFQLNTFLTLVKSNHPVVKQARLKVDEGEAKLLKARGNFDPKFNVANNNKQYKDKTYYNILNTTFKIPTWYGVELKATYDKASGVYLNPEKTVPSNGLYGVGLSVNVLKDLVINKRMASLKQAKLYNQQSLLKQQLLVNDILYESTIVYLDWMKAWNMVQIQTTYLDNAKWKLNNVKRKVETGDSPTIDTTEAHILVLKRSLDLEKAQLKYQQAGLKLSNFLWTEDLIPLELSQFTIPYSGGINSPDFLVHFNQPNIDSLDLDFHPKIKYLNLSFKRLKIEKRLKLNNRLPKVNLHYNVLTNAPDDLNTFQVNDFKGGFQVEVPLFFRKSRGDLRLTKIKINHLEYDIAKEKLLLKNKFKHVVQLYTSYLKQFTLYTALVKSNQTLLTAEEKKFAFGESSLFMVNTREKKLLETQLKQLEIRNKLIVSRVKWYKISVDMSNFKID